MFEALVRLKPHIAVLIVFHIICNFCVGCLTVLVHSKSLFLETDTFRLILLSLIVTAPLTAFYHLMISFVMALAFKISTSGMLKSDLNDVTSMVASAITLMLHLAINFAYFTKEEWSILKSVNMVGFATIGAPLVFLIPSLFFAYQERRERKTVIEKAKVTAPAESSPETQSTSSEQSP